MRHYFLPSLALIIGLITSQFIFSIVVYFSNLSLYQNLFAIKNAGYLIVPNIHIVPTLLKFGPAFKGAIFFTLTTGAGLTLLTFILMMIWRAVDYSRLMFGVILILWASLIAAADFRGFNLAATSAFIIIPVLVAIGTLVLAKKNQFSYWKIFLSHCIVLLIIILLWIPYLKNNPFITFRDNILLGNSIGRKINDFYYKYTMYPAEVFKSFDQKLLKTCTLEIENEKSRQIVENKLRRLDYLSVGRDIQPDVKILEKHKTLIFIHDGKTILQSPIQNFISNPYNIMMEFSENCDHYAFFRRFTFISLIIGFSLSIYILLHAAIMFIFSFVFSIRRSFFISSALCLILGVSLLFPLHSEFSGKLSKSGITDSLSSDNWRYRTLALRTLTDENTCIEPYLDKFNYKKLKYIPEKYWFVRSLSACKDEYTYKILQQYLNDSNPNVVCMALYSLGKRDRRQSIHEIIQLINSSGHWYVQWYAYKALKRLGWTQPKSTRFR